MSIRAIEEWQAPTKVSELRSFLGLVNYYRRFMVSYSQRSAQLFHLLNSRRTYGPIMAFPTSRKSVQELLRTRRRHDDGVLQLPD